MTQFLPPNLLALFAPRDPVPYLIPVDKLPHEKKRVPYSGVSAFLTDFEETKDTPPPTRVETRDERKERKRKERAEMHAYKLEQELALWDAHNNVEALSDPYKTLFVARVNFDSSESKLRREFEVYGPVQRIKLVIDKAGKNRGYAFIEYEHERDMHSAYKHADGKKIDGRRVLVDIERGRTIKGWRPRRLGGGLGGTRRGGPEENTRFSGRDEYSGNGIGEEGRGGRERSRSRDRGGERRRRSRSRERRRSRSRERRQRSRSRDRDRKRPRRSRSRERRRSRSPRDRKRQRSRDRRRDRDENGQEYPPDVKVKMEPADKGYEKAAAVGEFGDQPYEQGYGDQPPPEYPPDVKPPPAYPDPSEM